MTGTGERTEAAVELAWYVRGLLAGILEPTDPRMAKILASIRERTDAIEAEAARPDHDHDHADCLSPGSGEHRHAYSHEHPVVHVHDHMHPTDAMLERRIERSAG